MLGWKGSALCQSDWGQWYRYILFFCMSIMLKEQIYDKMGFHC